MMQGLGSDLEKLLGEPKRAIRSMFLAFFIAEAAVLVNQFTDTFWVSGLGTEAGSAVAAVAPLYSMMTAAGIGIALGATVSIACRLGRGEDDAAGGLAGASIFLGLVSSVAVSAIMAVLLRPAIGFMGADDVAGEAEAYMLPFIVLSSALILNSIVGGILRGEGAARRSAAVQLSASVLNMVLDPIFIYALGLGVLGAGLATAVSAAASLSIGLFWLISGWTAARIAARDIIRPRRDMMKEVIGISGPKTGQQLVSDITDLLQRVFIIMAGGTSAVMLYNYPWRYMGLAHLPGSALEKSMVPVCSAAYGQNDASKMREGYIYTAELSVSAALVLMVLMYVFADPLMSVMTIEESMREMRPDFVKALRISVLVLPFSSMMGLGSSMLQSMKKARIPMDFYLVWGFVKLGLYAVACQYSIWAILWCMVAVHIAGGVCLMLIAYAEFRRMRARDAGRFSPER